MTGTLLEYLRKEVAEDALAPEAIEFYDWYPAHRTEGDVEAPIRQPLLAGLGMPTVLPEPRRPKLSVKVKPTLWLTVAGERYRIGWDAKERVVVAWIL